MWHSGSLGIKKDNFIINNILSEKKGITPHKSNSRSIMIKILKTNILKQILT